LPLAWKKANGGRRSKPHKLIEEYLRSIGTEFISECMDGRFKKFNKFVGSEYSPIPDIVLNNQKIVIEIYGDVWHANPEKYKSTDIIYKYGGPVMAHDIRIFDRARQKQIESFGYKVIVLWEHDIKHRIDDIKKSLLKTLVEQKP
jgi:G:T-mismatch repair DNA endonuclease (very short patch repair protein)